MNENIISTLVGLAGACGNNGKTENTDAIVMKGMLNCFADTDSEKIADEIKQEKFTISPGCATCPTPCGNTSDYDMNKFHGNEELKAVKEELLKEASALTERLYASDITELPTEIYQAISFFGYELVKESYTDLIEKLKQMEV